MIVHSWPSRRLGIIYFLLILICIPILYRFFHSHHTESPFTHSSIDDNLRVDLNFVTNESFQCVKTKILLGSYRTTVCVHDVKRDSDVSGLLVSAGIWEEGLVTRLVSILTKHNHLAFFDIGANVGVYTMYAASVGCPTVVSVECFQPNIDRIRRAVQLEGVQQRVVLVPRALYSRSGAYLSLRANIANNIGSQRLNAEVPKTEHDPLVVQTIRFDDLLPIVSERNIKEAIIKIDIETSEHFLCETGSKMFDRVNIVFVMMEWANIKHLPARASVIVQFFVRRHYVSVNADTCQVHSDQTNYLKWKSQDIYWIKKNSLHLCGIL